MEVCVPVIAILYEYTTGVTGISSCRLHILPAAM